MADNYYVPQVDYTSRDYTAIRNDLVNLIPYFAPSWTSRDSADFGIVLIELFSYMGDMLSHYIDRSANEAFITKASQRENVLLLAKLLSYIPTESTAATVTLTFQNSTASPITVPALTKVATTTVTSASSSQIIFETNSAVTVPAKVGTVNGSVTVKATQGTTVSNEIIGTSDGSSSQTFKLLKTPVINNSIQITINGVSYTRVPYLIDYNTADPVYSTYTDAQNITYITFGDNISGRIPPSNAQIYATYRIGGGTTGNVASNLIKYVLTNATPGLTVNNQDISVTGDGAATGGGDAESTDSIRVNAPKSVRALNRAVSLKDYAYVALQVSGVAKATATADVYTSVTVYFAPFGDSGLQVDGVTPSTVFNTLATTMLSYFADKAPANTSVTFQPPKYVAVDLILDITVLPQYKQALVSSNVSLAIEELLAFDNVSFEDRITLQDVMTLIGTVEGVAYCKVNLLCRTDAKKSFSISNKALTSNVATLTTSATHNFKVGETVLISGVDSTFNGTFVITAVTTTTFSYALTSTNVVSTAVSPVGSALVLTVGDIVCVTNEIPKKGTVSISATGGIVS